MACGWAVAWLPVNDQAADGCLAGLTKHLCLRRCCCCCRNTDVLRQPAALLPAPGRNGLGSHSSNSHLPAKGVWHMQCCAVTVTAAACCCRRSAPAGVWPRGLVPAAPPAAGEPQAQVAAASPQPVQIGVRAHEHGGQLLCRLWQQVRRHTNSKPVAALLRRASKAAQQADAPGPTRATRCSLLGPHAGAALTSMACCLLAVAAT